jgi:hypothetical protein
MIEVFKTNITYTGQAARMLKKLGMLLPYHKINFDLEDCDKILRIEGEGFDPQVVMALLGENGLVCVRLE